MTIDQIKEDIASGKCKSIYYSSCTLWFTHLTSDVEEATKLGIENRKALDDRYLCDPANSIENKNRYVKLMKELKKLRKKRNGVQIPLDPTGAPLLVMHDPTKWLTMSENAPTGHYGKHGLDAFILTHHQNCKDFFSNKWDAYNNLIDKRNGTSNR